MEGTHWRGEAGTTGRAVLVVHLCAGYRDLSEQRFWEGGHEGDCGGSGFGPLTTDNRVRLCRATSRG